MMIAVRNAQTKDVGAIVRLINTAFLVEQFFIERDRSNPEMIRNLLEKGQFLLAEDGPQLVGCVYVELRGEHGYLGMLSVDPARQRSGVGRQLIANAEQFFRAAGCRSSQLRIVNVRTELLALYRRLGYEVTGTSPYDAVVTPKMPVHFIHMSKPLVP
jgi:ribosomal protein S18 acetylase RimI-like enzyme